MRFLILGGTGFLSYHVVESVLRHGHRAELLHRGRRPGWSELPQRLAAREDERTYADGTWDALIDCCAYWPRQVEISRRALRGRIGNYILISSISVYAENRAGADESAALLPVQADPEPAESVPSADYGWLKAGCEARLEDDGLCVRAGVLVGPRDPKGRLHYWERRRRDGRAYLLPGSPERPLQLLDARDLADWLVQSAARRGTFNALGPRRLWSELDNGQGRWISDSEAQALELEPWTQVPLWIPGSSAHFELDGSRAGLRCRPLSQTRADLDLGEERPEHLSRDREHQLLESRQTL